ncbi:MAG: GNAT family N-acetyltransferase, partial [Candidatus Nitrosocosmicus sp.]|nr:GNAT family N-acetyltransferase [Candidatus Nitrosocosmicus sp.]
MKTSVRKVRSDDWDMILNMRNEREIREVSHNNEIITKDKHYKYMKKLEQMEHVYQWMITFEDRVVGYVKIIDGEISYMIKKGYRGKGIGNESFKLVEEEIKKIGIKKITASIKVNNEASLKWIQRAGYKKAGIVYNEENFPSEYIMEKIFT